MSLSDKLVLISTSQDCSELYWCSKRQIIKSIKELKKDIPDAYKDHVIFLIDKHMGKKLIIEDKGDVNVGNEDVLEVQDE